METEAVAELQSFVPLALLDQGKVDVESPSVGLELDLAVGSPRWRGL